MALGRRLARQRHWTSPPAAARSTVSSNVNTATANRINTKLTDMVPAIPGIRTFNIDASTVSRIQSKYPVERDALRSADRQYPSRHAPEKTVSVINSLAFCVIGVTNPISVGRSLLVQIPIVRRAGGKLRCPHGQR